MADPMSTLAAFGRGPSLGQLVAERQNLNANTNARNLLNQQIQQEMATKSTLSSLLPRYAQGDTSVLPQIAGASPDAYLALDKRQMERQTLQQEAEAQRNAQFGRMAVWANDPQKWAATPFGQQGIPFEQREAVLGQFVGQSDVFEAASPKVPESIQKLNYLMQNPEAMAAQQALNRSGASSVNVALDKPLPVSDLSKIRLPNGQIPPVGASATELRQMGAEIVDQRTPEQAGKESMLRVAHEQIPLINQYLFDADGEVNRTNLTNARIGTPFTEGQTLAAAFETGIQAITRSETGAAMPPQEVENARKRFQPSPLDNDKTIKLKWRMYQDFLSGSLNLINPNGGFKSEEFDKEFQRRMKGGGGWSIRQVP